MLWVRVLTVSLAFVVGGWAHAEFEFYLYNPDFKAVDKQSKGKKRTITLSGEPRIVATGVQETIHISGVRWRGRTIEVANLRASVKIDQLSAQADIHILGRKHTQKIASFPNVAVEARSTKPLVFELPDEIPLTLLAGLDNSRRWAVAGDTVAKALEAQVDQYFGAPSALDKFFKWDLSGFPGSTQAIIEKFIVQQKGSLLGQLVEGVRSSINNKVIEELLFGQGLEFPKFLSKQEVTDRWTLKFSTEGVWRLGPEGQESMGYQTSSADKEGQNILTAVLPASMLQLGIVAGLKNSKVGAIDEYGRLALDAAQSTVLATAMGLNSQELSLVVEDETWSPVVRPWVHPGDGRPRHFVDLLVFIEADGIFGVGCTFELPADGAPKMVSLIPLGDLNKHRETGGSENLVNAETSLGTTLTRVLVSTLINSRVDNAHMEWKAMETANRLQPLRVRTLGEIGVRNPELGTRWAGAVAVDFQLGGAIDTVER